MGILTVQGEAGFMLRWKKRVYTLPTDELQCQEGN